MEELIFASMLLIIIRKQNAVDYVVYHSISHLSYIAYQFQSRSQKK